MSTITIITEDTQKKFSFKNEAELLEAFDERKIYIGFREEYSSEKFYFEKGRSVVFSRYYGCWIDANYAMIHKREGYLFKDSHEFTTTYYDDVVLKADTVYCKDVDDVVLKQEAFEVIFTNGDTVYYCYVENIN